MKRAAFSDCVLKKKEKEFIAIDIFMHIEMQVLYAAAH